MPTISLDKADAWLAERAKLYRTAALKGVLSAGLRTVNYILTSIIPQTKPEPVARGVYRSGWRAVKIKNGVSVQNSLPHAMLIEYGVKAANVKVGMKMIDALTEWVRMKGIGGRLATHGKRLYLIKANHDEARSIAWAIAMNMKKKGIFNGGKGLNILGRAMKMAPTFLVQEVSREIAREIKRWK